MRKLKKVPLIVLLLIPAMSLCAPYNTRALRFKHFKCLFPPSNTMLPSTADYKFNGEWLRRKGSTPEDAKILVKSYVYSSAANYLVFLKFKRHSMPFCWWFTKNTSGGKVPKGWTEGACDINNDGIYESVWEMNGNDVLKWNFCDYWNCESY